MNDVLASTSVFRLPGNGKAMDTATQGGHRSGWRYVTSELRASQNAEGILLEDFVERTFHPRRRAPTLRERLFPTAHTPPVWKEPWIGIFHHPPNLPAWFNPSQHPHQIFADKRFRKSRPHLRGAIALSCYLGRWLEAELHVPVTVIKHPTEFPPATFSWEAFLANPEKKLVQVGWYLRNYRAIYQVNVPGILQKVHIAQQKPFILEAQQRTDRHSPYRHRPDVGQVRVVPWLDHDDYDRLFTENVIFLELFDASANNTIVEAIVRETPIVVNRHPAVAEYLGDDYPLFYDAIDEVHALLTGPALREAHEYLHALNKRDLRIEHFIEEVNRFASQVID